MQTKADALRNLIALANADFRNRSSELIKIKTRALTIARQIYGNNSIYEQEIMKIYIPASLLDETSFINQQPRSLAKNQFVALLQAMLDDLNNAELQTISVNNNTILGSPLTTTQFQSDIFMVMPFAESFRPIYESYIVPIAHKLSLSIKRGDDVFSKHDIMRDIWSLTNNARLIIADCTGKNANVFYEMGLAHALDKPIIMIAQTIDDIPFDVRGKRVIVYTHTLVGMEEFEEKLETAIKLILEYEN